MEKNKTTDRVPWNPKGEICIDPARINPSPYSIHISAAGGGDQNSIWISQRSPFCGKTLRLILNQSQLLYKPLYIFFLPSSLFINILIDRKKEEEEKREEKEGGGT